MSEFCVAFADDSWRKTLLEHMGSIQSGTSVKSVSVFGIPLHD